MELYTAIAGIQVTAKLDKQRFVPVPSDQLLTSSKRNDAAVTMALAPLTTRPKP